MLKISDFLEKKRPNDRIIQMSLREIDTQDLSVAMLGFTEDEQGVILRNMSKRASKLLLAEIDDNREAPQHRIESAMQFFVQKVRKHARYLAKNDEEAREHLRRIVDSGEVPHPELPEIDVENEESIVNTFVEIQKFVKKHGILSLEGIESQIDNPVMRKGIEYYIDGWEPLLMQSILDAYKTAHLKVIEKKLEMILAGIDSLASKDITLVTEERLRAFISG